MRCIYDEMVSPEISELLGRGQESIAGVTQHQNSSNPMYLVMALIASDVKDGA